MTDYKNSPEPIILTVQDLRTGEFHKLSAELSKWMSKKLGLRLKLGQTRVEFRYPCDINSCVLCTAVENELRVVKLWNEAFRVSQAVVDERWRLWMNQSHLNKFPSSPDDLFAALESRKNELFLRRPMKSLLDSLDEKLIPKDERLMK